MANPVHLAVYLSPPDPCGFVEDPCWVFIHTDQPDANVSYTMHNPDGGAAMPTVIRFRPEPGGKQLALPPYVSTILRIQSIPEGRAFRLHISVKDSAGAREETHHSLHIGRQKQPSRGPTITFGSPGPGTSASPAQVNAAGFIACGYVAPYTNILSAWLVQQGTTTIIPSTALKPPAPYNWAFQFGGVAAGLYSLYVEANNDSTTLACSILNAS